MTIANENNRNAYSGNGSTTEFAVDFCFLVDADVRAILSTDATGVETELTLTTHYTLADAGEAAGGTLTMVTPPASGETLTILRGMTMTQGTDYVDNAAFPAETHEEALDRLTMLVQQLDEKIDRSFTLSPSQDSDPEFPLLVADKGLVVNATGDGFEMTDDDLEDLITDSAANASAASDSASAAATAETNAETAETNAAASAAAAAADANTGLGNLLKNTGWQAFSNADGVYNYGSVIKEDDCASDDTGDWNLTANATLTFDTDHYEFDSVNGALKIVALLGATVVANHIYRVSIDVKNGTAAGVENQLWFYDGAGHRSASFDTTAGWVTQTFIVKAATSTANGQVGFECQDNINGTNFEFKNFTFYEVTAGNEAADYSAPDGWSKDTTLDVYREPNGTNTKDGELYALKCTPSAANDFLTYPLTTVDGTAIWYERFLGRTVTAGAWIKTSTASHILIRLYDNVGSTSSAYHTGGGGWEWLEVTHTVSTGATDFRVQFLTTQTSGDYYISQPMMVFGSYIGEGNYSPPMDKWIPFDTQINSSAYYGSGFSDETTAVDIQVDSECKIGAGVNFLHERLWAKDSASASTGNTYVGVGTDPIWALARTGGKTNDQYAEVLDWGPVNADDTIAVTVEASGSGTTDLYLRYTGLKTR